ncbi:E3 ubiquitin/ISG15 ligase TRIM25-like [Engystomops pustulosus]|uniref:E3 ubiquitin/ISG15 ligase TRIM25-like n=1 Tax=Engystomops pustulosus TaxID=76066 RepID=UPI003AFA4801
MASADLREELDCSICLTTYTDPVMLRCGHNFCRVCIDRVLDTQDGSGGYSCPECREEFQERPALMRNLALRKIMENLLTTQPTPRETGILCSYCVDSPVPAVRSCLHCEASLCDKHLKVHSKSPEHVLSDPSTSLENRKCSVHKKILEYYCTEDATCICVSCRLDGEHQGHQVEMLDEASKKKKKKLGNVLQKLMTKRNKIEGKVQSLEESRRKAQEKASAEVKIVTALFKDMRRQMESLEDRFLSYIFEQEQEESLSLSALIQKLEIQKDELSRKMRHIEELCNRTDPLTVLQEPDTGDLCDPEEGGGDEDTGGHDGQLCDIDLCHIFDTIRSELLDIVDKTKSSLDLGSGKQKSVTEERNHEGCVFRADHLDITYYPSVPESPMDPRTGLKASVFSPTMYVPAEPITVKKDNDASRVKDPDTVTPLFLPPKCRASPASMKKDNNATGRKSPDLVYPWFPIPKLKPFPVPTSMKKDNVASGRKSSEVVNPQLNLHEFKPIKIRRRPRPINAKNDNVDGGEEDIRFTDVLHK